MYIIIHTCSYLFMHLTIYEIVHAQYFNKNSKKKNCLQHRTYKTKQL